MKTSKEYYEHSGHDGAKGAQVGTVTGTTTTIRPAIISRTSYRLSPLTLKQKYSALNSSKPKPNGSKVPTWGILTQARTVFPARETLLSTMS